MKTYSLAEETQFNASVDYEHPFGDPEVSIIAYDAVRASVRRKCRNGDYLGDVHYQMANSGLKRPKRLP
jgi:hypothetical protein